jgi:hypothetical protein
MEEGKPPPESLTSTHQYNKIRAAPMALMAGLHYGFSLCLPGFARLLLYFLKTHNFGQLILLL